MTLLRVLLPVFGTHCGDGCTHIDRGCTAPAPKSRRAVKVESLQRLHKHIEVKKIKHGAVFHHAFDAAVRPC